MLWINILFALVQLAVGIIFAAGSVYFAMNLLDRFTKGMHEIRELRKGNLAVAIYVAAFIFSISIVIESGVAQIVSAFNPESTPTVMTLVIVFNVIKLFISVVLAVVAIYLALQVINRITPEINEFEEIASGNVAVALFTAAVLISVSFVIRATVSNLSDFLDPVSLAFILSGNGG
ncbi:MAG: DUF350 domain-containing protein [Candidatus Anstonellales archaeon]